MSILSGIEKGLQAVFDFIKEVLGKVDTPVTEAALEAGLSIAVMTFGNTPEGKVIVLAAVPATQAAIDFIDKNPASSLSNILAVINNDVHIKGLSAADQKIIADELALMVPKLNTFLNAQSITDVAAIAAEVRKFLVIINNGCGGTETQWNQTSRIS